MFMALQLSLVLPLHFLLSRIQLRYLQVLTQDLEILAVYLPLQSIDDVVFVAVVGCEITVFPLLLSLCSLFASRLCYLPGVADLIPAGDAVAQGFQVIGLLLFLRHALLDKVANFLLLGHLQVIVGRQPVIIKTLINFHMIDKCCWRWSPQKPALLPEAGHG